MVRTSQACERCRRQQVLRGFVWAALGPGVPFPGQVREIALRLAKVERIKAVKTSAETLKTFHSRVRSPSACQMSVRARWLRARAMSEAIPSPAVRLARLRVRAMRMASVCNAIINDFQTGSCEYTSGGGWGGKAARRRAARSPGIRPKAGGWPG